MKRWHKWTSLLAILSLLLTLWAPVAVSAAPAEIAAPRAVAAQQAEDFYFGRSILAQMPNGEALCYTYD